MTQPTIVITGGSGRIGAVLVRHFLDKLLHPRSTRLVMGNALIARMLHSYIERQGLLVTNTEVTQLMQEGNTIQGVVLQQTLPDGRVVKRTVHSKGGVVMASGGFNRHAKRRADMLPGANEAWCPAAPCWHCSAAQSGCRRRPALAPA